MGRNPTVREYMTYAPQAIAHDQSVSEALNYMRKLRIRHLPVLRAGKPIGVLTDHDIGLATKLKPHDLTSLKVEDILVPVTHTTTPDTFLSEITARVSWKEPTCVLVIADNVLVGIFTESDAYRALSDAILSA